MKLKSLVEICIVLSLFAMPALAEIDDGDTGMVPSFSEAWGGLTPFLKEKISWLIGLSLVALVVVGVLYSILSSGSVLWAGQRGDAAGRSSGISNVVLGIGVIFAALLAISIIFWLVS